MKLKTLYLAIPMFVALNFAAFAQPTEDKNQNIIWMNTPAATWNEALPIGNGRLGAMIFGGVSEEHLQLNEESIWSKTGHLIDKNVQKELPKVRQMIFDEKFTEAQKLITDKFFNKRPASGSNAYQTMGDLHITFEGLGNVRNYRRELDLNRALATVSFQSKVKNKGFVTFKRQYFSSAPDQVMVMKLSANRSSTINCHITMDRPGNSETVRYTENEIIMDGCAIYNNDKSKHLTQAELENSPGVHFQTRVKLIPYGGEIIRKDDNLYVKNADSLELRLVAATDYWGNKPSDKCNSYQQEFKDKKYQQILADHIAEYKEYFDRVKLNLGKTEMAKLPTDQRLAAIKYGVNDPGLVALYFQFGRYLLISSSRPGCLPANLQGIWNDKLNPAWNSDYHVNINFQMNYWPSEICNLSECHQPYFWFIDKLKENGEKTAKVMYGCRGLCVHHTSSLWLPTTAIGDKKPIVCRYAMWPMGGAWAVTQFYEHYLFTGDKDFLKNEAYPIMKEAALFVYDYMVKNPETGKYVTGPSISPENEFYTPSGAKASVNMGPTMDKEITWNLFHQCIDAAKILNIDKKFSKQLSERLDNMEQVKIAKDGRIMEWSKEYKEAAPNHRHISHLYGLYPSSQINKTDTPDLFEAAKKVIKVRLDNGGGQTGWSRAWVVNYYARLADSENAHNSLMILFKHSTLPNLFDTHPPFQIDGNFGATAGIAEMLLQSQAGYVDLLPALPKEWSYGEVSGLCARGGFTLDIKWKDGKLQKVKVHSKNGSTCRLRYGNKEIKFDTVKGEDKTFSVNDFKL